MPQVSLTGEDTIIINNRIITGQADGDVAVLEYPNDVGVLKTGKNGNSIYALNLTGNQATLSLRLLRASSDDKFLNGLLAAQMQNFSGFILMTGEFIKQVGDGLGNITQDKYILSGGIFMKRVTASSNQEGNTDQSVAVYNMVWSNSPRVIV